MLNHTMINKLLLLWPLGCLLMAPMALSADAISVMDRLIIAAEKNNQASVIQFIKEKANPNLSQADGMTALLWAVYHDNNAMAHALIQSGADVSAANRYGVTALSLACANGNSALVKLLLEKGADPNISLKGGETALMTASRTGRLGAVTALLKHGAQVDAKEHRGQTAIMWAAAQGHADVVDALIREGADFRTPLESGFTPLCFAVRNGRIAVTRRLLSAGVDVNKAMTKAKGGRNKPVKNTSPLLLAMESGHYELAEVLLVAGADSNDARSTGFTPLHAMSWIRKPEKGDNESGTPPPIGSGRLSSLQFVHCLVKHGADVNFQRKYNGGGHRKISTKGTTPFLCAAGTADVEYMKTLLALGADWKIKNDNGHTALIMAAGIGEKPEGDGAGTKSEHLNAVKFLLELGENIDAVDKNGETVMHAAAYKSLPKVVMLLADRGADIKVWATPSKKGRTPLSIAQGYRPGNFKPSFETVEAIKKVMIAQGVTPPPPPKTFEEKWRD